METRINKLLEYFDDLFLEEKVVMDDRGRMGHHYKGLILDEYLENSVLGIDFLSIEDYFDSEAQIEYYGENSLYNQYSEKDLNIRLRVIGVILSLVRNSNYRVNDKDIIINKTVAFLERIGFKVVEDLGKMVIIDEMKKFEGSYSNIYEYNEQFYKKQLKGIYLKDPQWIKRFKYEYENMHKLYESPHVLKVLNYNSDDNSYIMEKCDCNLDDYIKLNPKLNENRMSELILQLILGMIDVHNAGIIHRDLHLGNILIKEDHVVLADFGLSKDVMVNHSLRSSSTPKNSHYFMDPIGFISFTSLDKLSDIYSIGKIIDYITKDMELNEKLSYIISKSTHRDRNKRYQRCNDMYDDINSAIKEISYEDKIKIVEKNIQKGIMSPDVHDFINKLVEEESIAMYIVRNRLYDFWKLILKLNETDQVNLLNIVEDSYVDATGYKGFTNYDLFAVNMYNIIRNTDKLNTRKIAYSILKGCSQYRFKAATYLKEVDLMFFNN